MNAVAKSGNGEEKSRCDLKTSAIVAEHSIPAVRSFLNSIDHNWLERREGVKSVLPSPHVKGLAKTHEKHQI